jgi:BirA family biotin operon repressor/biotin-[acetyl-CoA-carboxylase] ligase
MRSEPLPADLADAFARAAPRLGTLGSPILYFSSIGSTNDVAAALAAEGARAVVVADAQTAGRGRRGRVWFSPPLSGLYVSAVLELPGGDSGASDTTGPFRSRARALLTLAAGVALAEGVQAVTGLRVDIKWPNDLLVGSRKLAGILAEATTAHAVVLGYGINIGSMAYPPDLADRATSLESELGRPIDRAELCVETLVALARRHADLEQGRFDAILDAWRQRAPGSVGRRVAWETSSGSQSGVTAGIDETGALLVTVGDRVERLFAGEVTWA